MIASAGVLPDDDLPTFNDDPRRFAHLRGEFDLFRVVSDDSNTSLRLDGRPQLAGTTFPKEERFTVGHAPFLRGYAPAEIEGDDGLSGTIKLSSAYEKVGRGSYRTFALCAFASAGRAWVRQPKVAVIARQRRWSEAGTR